MVRTTLLLGSERERPVQLMCARGRLADNVCACSIGLLSETVTLCSLIDCREGPQFDYCSPRCT